MIRAWRICKTRHHPFDGTGARLHGARWNSPGSAVVYAADSFAGAILEVLAHSFHPRALPGSHHAVRIEIPSDAVEVVEPEAIPAWEERESASALRFGDEWLAALRSPALVVPALPCRPVGRNVLINPAHPGSTAIRVSDPFPVPWDERLF
jgi:RES domain-containing protein